MIRTYHNNAWIPLAGKKIYHNGSWHTIHASDKVYSGNTWYEVDELPLRLTAQAANSSVSLGWVNSGSVTHPASLYYRTAGTMWAAYTPGTSIQLAAVGDWVEFKNAVHAFSNAGAYYQFTMSGQIAASGNIMSLLDYGDLLMYAFMYLFSDCTALTTAPELPATTLSDGCYAGMFNHCTALTTAPELPATTLSDVCYHSMFNRCTALSSVAVAFTSWVATSTASWMTSVASGGTFTCPASLPEIRDANHIPTGWTIVRN